MNCYFCLRPISGDFHQNWDCLLCPQEYQLFRVITSTDTDGSLLYAHIFPTYKLQVRLHLRENLTYVEKVNTYEKLLEIPGFPITPANSKNKVKLYLTFL
jgi:hypothetical protein